MERRGLAALLAISLLVGGAAACSDEDDSLEVGSCIKSGDQGVEKVDCESGDAEQRLVKQAGSSVDITDPDCPEGSEPIAITAEGESVGIRWCAEPA